MSIVTTISLTDIAETVCNDPSLSLTMWVECLGGNVLGLVDYAGTTLTINDGQRYATVEENEGASVSVFFDGRTILTGEAHTMADVLALMYAAGEIN